MIAGVTRYWSFIIQIGRPSFVTGTNKSISILDVECRIITTHGPGSGIVGIFDLKNAIALVATSAIPYARWTKAAVGCPVTDLVLMPVRFCYSFSADDILSDTP